MAEMREPGASAGVGALEARMDRLPIVRTHRRACVAVGLGMFFDSYEIFLAGVLSGVLTREFQLAQAALTPVLASTFVGMFLGALLLGRAADRFGRRGAFLLSLAVYSVFSLVGAVSPNAVWLMVSRFCAGVGMGAELPLGDTYLTDLLPARHRGRYLAWAYTLGYCAVPVLGFLAHALVGTTVFGVAGWRWIFIIGSLGAMLVWPLRRALPESPRWLRVKGRAEAAEVIVSAMEAEARASGHHLDEIPDVASVGPGREEPVRAPLRELLRPPYGRRATMMVIFQLFQTIGYYGFGTMVPLILAAKGFPVGQSLLFTAVTYLGYPVGAAAAVPLVERFERKFLIIGALAGMAMFGLAFGLSGSVATILVFGLLYTATSNVFSSFHIYMAEIFPTALRGTAASGTYSLSRLSTAAMPFLLVPLLNSAGVTALFTVICAAMAVVAIDVAVLGPRTTGQRLETINQ